MAYAGLDRDIFPGFGLMNTLKTQTNLVWTGFYLAPAPNHSDTSWMSTLNTLQLDGWGYAPVYVGRQEGSPNLNSAQGSLDGQDAVTLLAQAGFPQNSVIYLDLESGNQPDQAMFDYTTAWFTAVSQAGCTAGLYCSHLIAGAFLITNPNLPIWAFNVPAQPTSPVDAPYPQDDPTGSGVPGARMWQRVQNIDISFDGNVVLSVVDLNTSIVADPSVP